MSIIGNQVSGCSANSHGAITKYTLPISALIFTHYLEYIYGINPVLASLSAQRREFQRLYMNITERQAGRQSNPLIEQISQMSKNYGVKVKYLNKVAIRHIMHVGKTEQLHDEPPSSERRVEVLQDRLYKSEEDN